MTVFGSVVSAALGALLGIVATRLTTRPAQIQELAGESRHQLAADLRAAHPPRLVGTRPGRTAPPRFTVRAGSDPA